MISWDNIRGVNYISIKQASKILGYSYSKTKEYLGLPDHTKRMANGHMKPLYEKKKVDNILKNIKRDRGYKVREDYKPYDRTSSGMELLEDGRFVKVEPTYKGRVCAMKGCNKPVPTGMYVCDKHRNEFKTRRKRYVEEYSIHI